MRCFSCGDGDLSAKSSVGDLLELVCDACGVVEYVTISRGIDVMDGGNYVVYLSVPSGMSKARIAASALPLLDGMKLHERKMRVDQLVGKGLTNLGVYSASESAKLVSRMSSSDLKVERQKIVLKSSKI